MANHVCYQMNKLPLGFRFVPLSNSVQRNQSPGLLFDFFVTISVSIIAEYPESECSVFSHESVSSNVEMDNPAGAR